MAGGSYITGHWHLEFDTQVQFLEIFSSKSLLFSLHAKVHDEGINKVIANYTHLER